MKKKKIFLSQSNCALVKKPRGGGLITKKKTKKLRNSPRHPTATSNSSSNSNFNFFCFWFWFWFFFYFSSRLKVIILRYIYTLYVYVIQCGVPALAAPDPAARWA